MNPIIDDYVGKYYQKRNNQSIINKKAFLHLSSHCMFFFYVRGLCSSFCIRKDTLLEKIMKKKDNWLEKGLIGRQ